jgi:rhomboid family GlyGly-CTERM serine protease
MQPRTKTPLWIELWIELHGIAVTVSLAVAAVAIQWIPRWADLLQFDRQAILDGQWWRMLTGHLTHWNVDHLFWDLAMFVFLGAMVERQSRLRLVAVCLVSAVSISFLVLWGQLDLRTYRGLSGLDTALFVYLACDQLAGAWRQRSWGEGLLPAILLAGFGGKLLYEVLTGSTLFVDGQTAGFVVVVMAHAVGAAAGAVLALFPGATPAALSQPHPDGLQVLAFRNAGGDGMIGGGARAGQDLHGT